MIGITTGSTWTDIEARDYIDAIRSAGADYILIDPKPLTGDDAARIIAGLDGLLLSGGADIHPRHFLSALGDVTGLIAENHMSLDENRDACEIPLTKAALDAGIPILGICRGFQVLNVVLGGGMVMDIHTEIRHQRYTESTESGHRPGESSSHPITVEPASRLAEIIGAEARVVNSRHHQGITVEEKADSFSIAAYASDGIVEAVESNEHAWVLAVQWHPERREDEYIYEPCRRLFRAFIDASEARIS